MSKHPFASEPLLPSRPWAGRNTVSLSFINAFFSTAWKCWRAASRVGVTLFTAKVTLWEKLYAHTEKHNQQFSTKCDALVKQDKNGIAQRGLFFYLSKTNLYASIQKV